MIINHKITLLNSKTVCHQEIVYGLEGYNKKNKILVQQPGNFNHNTSEGPNSHEWKTGSVNNIFDKWTSKTRFYELPAARFSPNNLKFLFKIKNIWRIYNRCQNVKNHHFCWREFKIVQNVVKTFKTANEFQKSSKPDK